MGYKKATHVLPPELLLQVQKYIDGEFLYIPRISDQKRGWGAATSTRRELHDRNERIYAEYLAGERMEAGCQIFSVLKKHSADCGAV